MFRHIRSTCFVLTLIAIAACGFGQSAWASAPSDVPTFVQIVTGDDFTCGLSPQGQAICWGGDAYGQVDAPDLVFSQIAAGGETACGITADTHELVCWGQSIAAFDPRMQSAVTVSASQFANAPRPHGTPIQRVAVGARHLCVLTLDGTARCWGDDSSGQTDAPSDAVFVQLSAGRTHTCGVTSDDEVLCWGRIK